MEQIKHEPIVYKVYNELSAHKGRTNAISCEKLALMFFPDLSLSTAKRKIRRIVNIIRNSPVFDNVIAATNEGYFWATTEEARAALSTAFKHAISVWRTLHTLEKKANLNGQLMIQLTPHQRKAIESLCEID